jgi:alpha,alpha-trehalase
VPGGRGREVYYWDSYFTMLGLEDDGEHQLALDLLNDFAFELDQFGKVPNGNRSYYLSRSQPPFFSLMVRLIGPADGNRAEVGYLPQLQQEWDFWTDGADELPPGKASRNSVRLSDGTLLNRYWDARDAPRDESYKEDVETAAGSGRPPALVYRNLRAAAESGWDFSSRWLTDGKTLATVRTLSILPVDLNCLLVHLEQTLSEAYRAQGDAAQAAAYQARALTRSEAIQRLMWDPQNGVFSDYLWEAGEFTGAVTAATLYPLFLRIATERQARVVAATVERKLLDVGGLATTLVDSGQQWDAPNGWAPLQWIAVVGLRNYGFDRLAHEIAARWVHENIAGYQPWRPWRRVAAAAARSAGTRAFGNGRGIEPGVERRHRTELGAALRQPQSGAAGVLIVLAPRQEQLDAVGVMRDMREREPGDLARPQRRGKPDEQQRPVAQPGERLRDRLDGGEQPVEHQCGLLLLSGRRCARLMPAKVIDTAAAAVGGE